MIEGAGAADAGGAAGNGLEAAHARVIAHAAATVADGGSVVMHCRGGVGRAGMMAACTLMLLREAATPKAAIAIVRQRRCKQAVETRRQEDFVAAYHSWVTDVAFPIRQAAFCEEPAVMTVPQEKERVAESGPRVLEPKKGKHEGGVLLYAKGGGGARPWPLLR